MKLFLSHQSALEHWRIHRATSYKAAQRRRMAVLPDRLPKTGIEVPKGYTLPLHVMLGNANARKRSKSMVQHVYRGETPSGCFVFAESGIMVSSPEFCFLQMANQLSLVKLIELGFELCGIYAMPASPGAEQPRESKYELPQLTSTMRIEALLDRMPGTKGHQKAKRAIRYVQDGSASPMETKLAMLLTLPYKMGGYGLVMPELNGLVVPSKAARRSSSKSFYSCDLYWPEYDLAVEYDSNLFHTGPEHIAADSQKRNSLALLGITVVTVTSRQLQSSAEFKKIATILAGQIGKRLQTSRCPGFAAAQRDLRSQLL